MLVRGITTNEFTPLKSGDSVQIALITMEDFGISNIPVVDENTLKGYVTNHHLEALDPMGNIGGSVHFGEYFLKPDHSFFEAISVFARSGLEVVAVAENGQYLGLVWVKDLVIALGRSSTIQSEGAVLALKCRQSDYSIAQLGRMIESSDGKILGMWTWAGEDPNTLEMMIKLNLHHVDNLKYLLSSNGYEVLYSLNNESDDYNESRFQSLLKYLDF
ncbi:MAG: CBS domain-containing protein [Bacteroidetes bacterium]|nr:CBS domain-containing protein [Bacteroidota bacterium]